jgi:hypothetical protein
VINIKSEQGGTGEQRSNINSVSQSLNDSQFYVELCSRLLLSDHSNLISFIAGFAYGFTNLFTGQPENKSVTARASH